MSSQILKPESGYATNPAKASMVFQAIPGVYFYIRMLGTVFSAARRARKKKYTSEDWIQSSLAIIRHLEKADCRFFIQGRDNFLDLQSPCVFVANHMSTLETFALGSIIRPHRPVTFVVKDSLVRYPVFKHVMISRD
ncbi:MAG: 1-acyl-sn-glycerol-3-phosphate acyltransferase, partial [Desulfonatronovibrionaceae bacterium]